MIVVGYYTTDTVYSDHIALLKASLDRFAIAYDFVAIDPGDWLKITAYKPSAILELMQKHQQSVLYLDADSVVHDNVAAYFDNLGADVAAYYKDDQELISSTVYFNYCDEVLLLLQRWKEEMVKTPEIWDQQVLQNLIESQEFAKIDFQKLEPSFTYIFDISRERFPNIYPKIEQLQASREGRHRKLMRGRKYRFLSKLGIYPKSTRRLQARRQRLAELSQEFGVAFHFDFQP